MRLAFGFLSFVFAAQACTAFRLESEDGGIVYCRSMEFAMQLDSHFLIVPRGTEYVGTAPNGKKGLRWKAKYGFAGLNQTIDWRAVVDGMNERGLVIGLLYFPGFAGYEVFDPARLGQTMGAWELGTYLLGSAATVKEAKALALNVAVAEQPIPGVGSSMPLHLFVGDRNGEAMVVEYVDGKQRIHENPVNVLTNSPPFDWQLTNLSNYVNLSPANVSEMRLGNWTVQNFGQGSGSLGMPGDYTPPSRFVRAALYAHWVQPPKTSEGSVQLGFHILNTFDIFDGAIQSKSDESDITQWVVVHDQRGLKSYFRTYESLAVQAVDFSKLDFAKPGFREIELSRAFRPADATGLSRERSVVR